jgi:hypothetical protein
MSTVDGENFHFNIRVGDFELVSRDCSASNIRGYFRELSLHFHRFLSSLPWIVFHLSSHVNEINQ